MVAASDFVALVRRQFLKRARIGPASRHAKRFAAFGDSSAIAFPHTEIFGEQYIETVKDSLGEHTVLRYKPVEGFQWKPSELKPGAKLNQPGPLFKKLEEIVSVEERARLGK